MHVKLLSYSSCLTLDLKETKFKSDGSNVLFVWSGGGEAQGKECRSQSPRGVVPPGSLEVSGAQSYSACDCDAIVKLCFRSFVHIRARSKYWFSIDFLSKYRVHILNHIKGSFQRHNEQHFSRPKKLEKWSNFSRLATSTDAG